MRITMLQDAVASPDDEMNRYGYEAGQTYTTSNPLDYSHNSHPLPISEQLAARFVANGLAVDADAEAESGDVASPSEVAAAPVAPAKASEPTPAAEAETEEHASQE